MLQPYVTTTAWRPLSRQNPDLKHTLATRASLARTTKVTHHKLPKLSKLVLPAVAFKFEIMTECQMYLRRCGRNTMRAKCKNSNRAGVIARSNLALPLQKWTCLRIKKRINLEGRPRKHAEARSAQEHSRSNSSQPEIHICLDVSMNFRRQASGMTARQ